MSLLSSHKKIAIQVYIFRAEDAFGKVSYVHDDKLSGYIKKSGFLPRHGDVINHNNNYYKVDKVIVDYDVNVINVLLSSSKVDVKIKK